MKQAEATGIHAVQDGFVAIPTAAQALVSKDVIGLTCSSLLYHSLQAVSMAGPVLVKWNGKEYSIAVDSADDVASLKRKLEADTRVLAKRQKILGLKTKAGKPAADADLLSDLAFKPGQKLMLMG